MIYVWICRRLPVCGGGGFAPVAGKIRGSKVGPMSRSGVIAMINGRLMLLQFQLEETNKLLSSDEPGRVIVGVVQRGLLQEEMAFLLDLLAEIENHCLTQ
jgi:hypothetical protein